MKRYGRPDIVVTDRLRSYRAAMREIGNEARQETGRWLNNRAVIYYMLSIITPRMLLGAHMYQNCLFYLTINLKSFANRPLHP